MMKIAINGFGRIGRIFLRNILSHTEIQVVAINDLTDTQTLAHLFKYDSVHRGFKGQVSFDADNLVINGQKIKVFAERDPLALPWKDLDIDLVIEATGKFTSKQGAQLHLTAGAKQVIISAPSTDKSVPTVVLAVNDGLVDLKSPILSNASCTTNNVAAMVKILDENWGIIDGYITTVHSMTGDQSLHDAPHKDLRRARAASASIIPTTTGAAKAITAIFPHLEGRLGGAGIRVPVLNGSLTDFTCSLKKQPTIDKYRGQGLGNQLVNFALTYLRGQKVNYVWCNARKKAVPFYHNTGFEIVSAEFDVPGIGPHYVMYVKLK